MWAGGRLHMFEPLRLGDGVERVSTIRNYSHKEGRTGPLAFVTVEHRISGPDGLACEEEQTIVYRGAPSRTVETTAPEVLTQEPQWRERFLPSSVALFRFSALTFNGHRIHYDYPHVTAAEGYPNVVVHAPLLALLLLDLAVRNGPRDSVAGYEYRATSPLYCGEPITLAAVSSGDAALDLWATDASGRIGMKATATWLDS
jgi:3-methylfumaryl-CoA hydratase